jgi:DNA-binding NarL/FixJ family response regulator
MLAPTASFQADMMAGAFRFLVACVNDVEAAGLDVIISAISPRIIVSSEDAGIRVLAKLIQRQGTQLLILDDDAIPFPDHTIPFLRSHRPKMKVMVLYSPPLDGKVCAYLRGGVQAIVNRQVEEAELRTIVTRVLRGQKYIFPEVQQWIDQSTNGLRGNIDTPVLASTSLSHRELQIVAGLLAGKRNKEIANGMNTSEQVIKNIFKRIYGKLNVRNKAELAGVILGFHVERSSFEGEALKAVSAK